MKLLPKHLDIWIYTGFVYEDIKDTKLAQMADYIVVGKFEQDKKCTAAVIKELSTLKMEVYIMNNDNLKHHGVLGMKWGVRRYQNKDGTLTPAGKKRVSKEYDKLSKKVVTEMASKNTKIYVDSYNKTADEYNNGKIDKFNKQYIKKGKTFDDPNYEKEYMNAFEKDRMKNFTKMYISELEKNENYRKAESLVKQYDMTKFDDLARENTKGREEVEKIIKGK